jgi:hypothetical protein
VMCLFFPRALLFCCCTLYISLFFSFTERSNIAFGFRFSLWWHDRSWTEHLLPPAWLHRSQGISSSSWPSSDECVSVCWIFVMRSLVNFWPLIEDVFGDVWHSPVRYGYESIAVDCYLCNSLLEFDIYIGFLGIETWPRRRVFSVHLTLKAAVCFYCLAESTFS